MQVVARSLKLKIMVLVENINKYVCIDKFKFELFKSVEQNLVGTEKKS